MVTYALLSNTLLLTVLVAILGNTFATINADAVAEVSPAPISASNVHTNTVDVPKGCIYHRGCQSGCAVSD